MCASLQIRKMHEHGYGSWDAIRADIIVDPTFAFDWFFQTRQAADIQRRHAAV